MKLRLPSPSLVLSLIALFVALGGGAALAAGWTGSKQQVKQLIARSTAANAQRLGGQLPNAYVGAKHFASSGGERFFSAGPDGATHTVTLGKVGHFKFTASCANPTGEAGAQQVTFDVTADTTAGLDGNAPQAAGNLVNIHTNSDAMDSTPDNSLASGDFDQVGSASSSTEIAADGQEVDVFYNDGVNWPAGAGSSAHDCFAGYAGLLG
jgi:hypothetical protein